MLRPANLQQVYSNFPNIIANVGSLKRIYLSKPDFDDLTNLMLKECERFWAATLVNLVAARELHKVWIHTWGDVSLYYASFFAMNAVLRLAGRSITFNQLDKRIFCIKRNLCTARNYNAKVSGGSDHRKQWDLYYDLIQSDVTDDDVLRAIFDFQLQYQHSERDLRTQLNYDLESGYGERHWTSKGLENWASAATSMYPFRHPVDALGDDDGVEIAIVVYIWKHLKLLLKYLGETTNFGNYWQMQLDKLQHFVKSAPFDTNMKEWAIEELQDLVS